MPAFFQGRVVAVLDRGFYGLNGAGTVIAVGDESWPPGPLAVRIPLLPEPARDGRGDPTGTARGHRAGRSGRGLPGGGRSGDGWRRLVAPGQRVLWDARTGVLAVAGRVWVAFDPRELRRWHPPRGRRFAAGGEVVRVARVLGHLLAVARSPGWLPFRDRVERLVRAAEAGDWATACGAADHLLGAGPGLTPSGDDWLAGFAAYWAAWLESGRPAPGARAFHRWCAYVAGRAPLRTTPVGAAFLLPALAGQLPEPAASLLAALLSGEAGAVPGLARRLFRAGHHSGVDTAWGLWMAARSLGPGCGRHPGDGNGGLCRVHTCDGSTGSRGLPCAGVPKERGAATGNL
ncbi:MAG TPA: DUF2877 domain-containing protein [Thermaerobacter sp.]